MSSQRSAEEVVVLQFTWRIAESISQSFFFRREVEFGRLVAYLGLDLFFCGLMILEKSRDSYQENQDHRD
jgi:hypothetical protein